MFSFHYSFNTSAGKIFKQLCSISGKSFLSTIFGQIESVCAIPASVGSNLFNAPDRK